MFFFKSWLETTASIMVFIAKCVMLYTIKFIIGTNETEHSKHDYKISSVDSTTIYKKSITQDDNLTMNMHIHILEQRNICLTRTEMSSSIFSNNLY